MASLRDIRKRIRSVKNTRQITKAMKMVAAAKLRKAQDSILAARPYADTLDAMIAELARRSGAAMSHPLAEERPAKRIELVVITSDRGLAGGFNSNIIRRANRFLMEREGSYDRATVVGIGRKGFEFFRRQRADLVRKDYPGLINQVDFAGAQRVADELTARFLADEVDEVHLVYNEFVSAITQVVKVTRLLPVAAPTTETTPETAPTAASEVDFEYEPDREAVLGRLIPQAVSVRLFRALLDSVASEHGARMSAMESATTNAGDMIDSLTLEFNRTRQAAITRELMEIVSGAEALK